MGNKSSISVIENHSGNASAWYSYEAIDKLQSAIYQCTLNWSLCENKIVHTDYGNSFCHYIVGVRNLLTICFTWDLNLSGAFINNTMFSRMETLCLYKVARYYIMKNDS